MRIKLLIAIAFFAGKCCVFAQTTDDLPERKPFILTTLIVDKGKANSIIVSPDIAEYKQLAKSLQRAIHISSGSELQIVIDDKIANKRGELEPSGPRQNMIVLGNLGNNGLVAHLYFRGYCAVDANYPGKNGYVVQTICDPWANGTNVIVLGGSNFTGVEKATERFCADLPKGATVSIPRHLKRELNTIYRISDPGDEEIAEILVKSAAEFKNGKQAGLFNPIVQAGNAYALSGNEGQAKLFRELLFLEYDLKTNSPAAFDSPWGGAADFLFAPLIAAWDKVEESPSFDEKDRKKMLDILLEYIHYYENYAYIPAFKTSVLRTNHHTFPGQGFTAAGQYFMKYYPSYAEGAEWLEMGDNCFRLQQQSWKSQEDCGSYAGISMRHMCYYATSRSDFTWFDSGRANIAGDLAIMTMDNLGYQCSFGDIAGFNSNKYDALWNSLATVQRNGRYSWAVQKGFDASKSSETDTLMMPVYVPPVEPTDLLGTKYFPMDSLFYATLNGRGNSQGKIKRENTFDKLFFRSSFDPQKQYLALDGVNVGYHGHRDGNSILRLTDRGRIWLADADYIKSSAKVHNTLLIFRDGETSGMPPFIRRDLVSDLPHIGMSRTTTTNYAGTDWTRNIIWDKERAFIIIDEVKANSAESYSISAQWHTLGKPFLNNNTFGVSQSGEQFTIQNLNGSRLRTFTDAEMGKNWIGYKYADPVITTLQQTAKRDMRKGEKMYIINVLSANSEGKNAIKAVRANDSMVVVGSGKDRAVIGVGGAKIDGVETDAKLYWLTRSRLALGGAKKLIIRNKIIFQSVDSVSAEIEAGKVVFIAEKLTRVTIPASGKQLFLDAAPVRAIKGRHPLTIDIPVGRHVITGMDLASEFAFGFPTDASVEPARPMTSTLQKLKEIAEFNPDNATIARPIAGDSHGLYVAGNDGIVYALTTDAKTRWKYMLGGDIRAIWTGKLTKDDPSRIVAGNAAGKIVVLDQNGKLIWQQQLPLYRSVSAVVYFTAADLSGDGNRSLIVGSDNWHHYAYDTAGSLLWEYLSIHPSSAGAAIDLDGDGKQEVIAGTQYYSWNAITPGGKKKWVINRVGPGANAVAAADLSEMTKPFVYIAGADGNIYAVDADGKRPWTFNTGDGATCLELMDVDGDGKKEILTGTLNSNLFAIKADGTRLWRRDVDEPILTMVQTDLDGDGIMEIVIGTDDGHVKALTGNGKPFAEWVTSGSVNKLITLSNGRVAASTNEGKIVVLGIK